MLTIRNSLTVTSYNTGLAISAWITPINSNTKTIRFMSTAKPMKKKIIEHSFMSTANRPIKESICNVNDMENIKEKLNEHSNLLQTLVKSNETLCNKNNYNFAFGVILLLQLLILLLILFHPIRFVFDIKNTEYPY